jgi:hypothetical protein
MLVDVGAKNLTGKDCQIALDEAGITVNKNTIPFETRSPFQASGIRLGTPWITQRGFDEKKTRQLADVMADVLIACAPHSVDTVRKGLANLQLGIIQHFEIQLRAARTSLAAGFAGRQGLRGHVQLLQAVPFSGGIADVEGSGVTSAGAGFAGVFLGDSWHLRDMRHFVVRRWRKRLT